MKKIESLEADLAEERQKVLTVSGNGHGYADGFVACMHLFQIMNKDARRRIYAQIIEHGPGYTRRIKGAKFRGVIL